MKKRILALLLVIVTLALTLTGCAFRYDKKDMTEFSTADFAKLDALLANFEIDDGDFGAYDKASGDKARLDKVLEKIDKNLSEKIDAVTANRLTDDNTYGLRQKIYYAFYCSVTVEGETIYFDTKYMDDTKLTTMLTLQKYADGAASSEIIGLSDLQKKIYEAISGMVCKDNAYDSESSGTLATDDVVFVTYKYTYMKDNAPVEVTTDYLPVTVVAKEGETLESLGELLNGKTLGKIEGTTDAPLKFNDPELGEVKISSMTAHFRIKAGSMVEVKDTTYSYDNKFTNAANAADSAKVNVKNEEITYYVYPAYAYEIPEFNAENVVNLIFGEKISKTSLPCFEDDEKLTAVVDKIAELKADYDSKNSKATATGATDDQKKASEEAKKALDAKVKTLYADLLAVDSGVAALIKDDYKDVIYDELEAAYDSDLKEKLSKAIWQWAKENIKVDETKLPKSGVKEAQERILASHKNTYYTGKDSSSVAYADTYKSFNDYLLAVAYKVETMDEVDAAVLKEAQTDVVEIIRVYALAQHFIDAEKIDRVTKADVSLYIDELYPQLYYTFYLSGNYSPTVEDVRDLYGDTALRTSLTFNRVMDYLLKTEEKDGHPVYTNITVKVK